MSKILIVFFFSFSFIRLNAQERIDADRPDQTEGVFTVPKGWMQVELGIAKEKWNTHPQEIYSYTFPTLLTKYGISKKCELRLITEYNRWGSKNRWFKDTLGLLPVKLGFKLNLYEGKGIIPRISLLCHTSFNQLASKLARGGSFFAPDFIFSFQHEFAQGVSLGYNFGMEWFDIREKPSYVYTIVPGFDIGKNWGAYIELFGSFGKNLETDLAFDTGLVWYLNDDIKLDVSGGVGITGVMKNYFGIGASVRFRAAKK